MSSELNTKQCEERWSDSSPHRDIQEGNCNTGRKIEGILIIRDSYNQLSMPMHRKRLEIYVKTDVHMKYEANKKERIWKMKLLGIDQKERTYLPASDKCTVGQHPAPHNHQFIAMQSANSRLLLQLCLQNKGEICEKMVVENLCGQFLQKGVSKNNLSQKESLEVIWFNICFSRAKLKEFCFIRACILFCGVNCIMSHIDQFTGTLMFISEYNSDNFYVLVIQT